MATMVLMGIQPLQWEGRSFSPHGVKLILLEIVDQHSTRLLKTCDLISVSARWSVQKVGRRRGGAKFQGHERIHRWVTAG